MDRRAFDHRNRISVHIVAPIVGSRSGHLATSTQTDPVHQSYYDFNIRNHFLCKVKIISLFNKLISRLPTAVRAKRQNLDYGVELIDRVTAAGI